MTTTSVFMNGRSQAVRLPKDFRLDCKRVEVKRVKEGILLIPERRSFDSIAEVFGKADADFIPKRIQPPLTEWGFDE